jgi:hypothetical protein
MENRRQGREERSSSADYTDFHRFRAVICVHRRNLRIVSCLPLPPFAFFAVKETWIPACAGMTKVPRGLRTHPTHLPLRPSASFAVSYLPESVSLRGNPCPMDLRIKGVRYEWHCRGLGWRGPSPEAPTECCDFLSYVIVLLPAAESVSCFWPSLADGFHALLGLSCEVKPGRA